MIKEGEERQDFAEDQETEKIVNSLLGKLPDMAIGLIQNNQHLSEEEKTRFSKDPDDPALHEPKWHQWGIVTHTKKFEQFYRQEVSQYLDKWKIHGKVQNKMAEKIDGRSKNQLLEIAIALHDLGKFAKRKSEIEEGGFLSASFKGHEVTSGEIIRRPEFSGPLMHDYNLTPDQIKYIARCTELHYELGTSLRDKAVRSDMGYTLAFAHSNALREQVAELMSEYPDFELEVGLLFFADCLAKTEIRITADTDEQIEDQNKNSSIKDSLEEKHLNPRLIKAVKQLPVSIAVMEVYLKMWAEKALT